jgi:HK97 family phage portal protein
MKLIPNFVRKMFHLSDAPEGQWRETAGIGERGNMFLIPRGDGFQRNLGGNPCGVNGTVMACVMTISRILAASYPNHTRVTEKGGRLIVTNSVAHRIMMNPNPAQNAVDFIGWLVVSLMLYGNAYCYIKRNDRNEVDELVPLTANGQRAFIAPNGELYYDLSNNGDFYETLDFDWIVPARDVFHVKLPSRNSVLKGDSPITYAYASLAVNDAVLGSTAAFTTNMSRPSGILSTDANLSGSQMVELRERFDEVTKGVNQGKVPVLANGLTWQSMSVTAHDAQLLQAYNASVIDIARVFGVPLPLLGTENNVGANSVATLIGQFKAGSLLYVAELIEFNLESLFNMDHYVDTVRFDLENVARADFETEINTLSKATQNGIYSPNEARNRVGLDSVPYGDEPRVQAQNVRLEDAKPAPAAPSAGKTTAPSNTGTEDDGSGDVTDTGTDDGLNDKFADEDYVTLKLQQLIKSAQAEIAK